MTTRFALGDVEGDRGLRVVVAGAGRAFQDISHRALPLGQRERSGCGAIDPVKLEGFSPRRHDLGGDSDARLVH